MLSNFDDTNAFGPTRRELLISTSKKASKENDRLFAADSLQYGSMTLQARDGPVTLMPSSGAQMGFTLGPRDLFDCHNPKVDLRTVDCTDAWLDAVNPCDPSRRVVDLSSATFMDDISRIQIFAAPPSVAEVVFKMNRAHSLLEESPGEGDWTLNASKTANDIMMREEGANVTTKGLTDKRRGLRGVAWKANENITAEIGRRAIAARRGWRQCGRQRYRRG